MTIVKHEWKQGRISFLIWTGSIVLLILICILLYPEMKGEMESVGDIFASMGSFTAAFGMDRLNFGTLIGFYSVECGNILGLGGAFFASLLGISALAKEEKERTAEFLLSHPISRTRVIAEKLAAVLTQIIVMNAIIFVLSVGTIVFIGEEISWKEIILFHTAYLLLQIELACICFGCSAFLRRGSIGIGIGIATLVYFLNLMANMTDRAGFLKYFTPFAYCEGADIVNNGCLDGKLIAIGMVLSLIGIAAAFIHYRKKDIQ
ncbi:MAG: ABC transporter permease subunit [Clostridiales bacterium]|nr:ABC transporter permease subunit [Clostridiales bacterium]